MLDWMKGVVAGRKGSPLQKLLEGAYKDEAEKQSLLAAVASDDGVKAEMLLPLLASKDAAVQQRASTIFQSRADHDAAQTLFAHVAGLDPGAARAHPLKTLARLRAELLGPAVDRALKDPVPEKLRAAWSVVVELPAEVSDAYLERAVSEGPAPVRFAALERLVKKVGDGARTPLLASATDRDARVRKLAVESLSKLSGNDVFETMLDRLSGDDNAEIRGTAGAYLQTFITTAPAEMRPSILGRLLLAGDPDLQSTLLKALFSTGSVHELLLEILTFCKTILGNQHLSVMNALKSLGDPVLEATLPLLAHADADVRVQALLLAERFASPRTLTPIVKLLSDPDWWARIMAVEALGRAKDPRVLPHLEKMLGDVDCKYAAIDAIGTIGGESAFANLLGLIRDPQPEVRLAAINALAKVQDSRVLHYVEEVAKTDASLDVRIRAVELVRELKGASAGEGGAAITSDKIKAPMDKLLAYARESGASDLHVTPGEPPILRRNGVLQRVQSKALPASQVETLINEVLDSVRRPVLEKAGAVDFCYSIAGVGRYRTNVFRQQRGVSAAFRCIPNVAPTLGDLGLPKHLDEIHTYHQGIVLLTGPAGSGKSTSLTALVNVINETRQAHVLTLEDPIEFLHPTKKALVNQREVGRDTRTFAAAMRAALREDPDVIVVGEMRDRETIRLALLAAETGHLVIATMQTTGAVATIDKLVESFPTDEQQQVRVSLSGSLKLIVSQQLVPRADGSGRAAIFEILKTTSPIRTIIREGKTFQLPSAMQIGRSQGMLTIDASLEEALDRGLIALDTAIAYAEKKDLFTKPRVPATGKGANKSAVATGASASGGGSSHAGGPAAGAATSTGGAAESTAAGAPSTAGAPRPGEPEGMVTSGGASASQGTAQAHGASQAEHGSATANVKVNASARLNAPSANATPKANAPTKGHADPKVNAPAPSSITADAGRKNNAGLKPDAALKPDAPRKADAGLKSDVVRKPDAGVTPNEVRKLDPARKPNPAAAHVAPAKGAASADAASSGRPTAPAKPAASSVVHTPPKIR